MEKIKKVFIDCGAWNGDSIKIFQKYNKGFEIYAFECEPRLTKELTELSKLLDFKFINKAVWIFDSPIKLYPGKGDLTQSSSLDPSKKKYIDQNNPVEVEAINFSHWIIDNFSRDDYIICKMNIEGAEYHILPHMIKTGAIYYIAELYIAWHWRKIQGVTEKEHNKLVENLAGKTTLLKWSYEEGKTENPF